METIEAFRKQVQRLAAEAVGGRAETPTLFVGQKQSQHRHHELLALPVDVSHLTPLQDLTPGAGFGEFYFLPDYDEVDSAPVR